MGNSSISQQIGRWLPVVGWLLVYDERKNKDKSLMGYCAYCCYFFLLVDVFLGA
jgi:hypothetical protein